MEATFRWEFKESIVRVSSGTFFLAEYWKRNFN